MHLVLPAVLGECLCKLLADMAADNFRCLDFLGETDEHAVTVLRDGHRVGEAEADIR